MALLHLSNKTVKAAALGLFVSLSLYSGLWFWSAHQLKQKLKETIYSSERTTLSFNKVKIYGFPFKLKAKINNLYFRYRFNNNIFNLSFEVFANDLTVKTNLFFNHAMISFPNKSALIFTRDNKASKFEISSDHNHYLEIYDANLINLHKIVKSLYHKKLPESSEFNLERIVYHSKNLNFTDQDNKTAIMNSDANIDSKMLYEENRVSGIELKTRNLINIKDKQFFDTFFSKIFSEIDFYANIRSHDNMFIVNKTDLRSLKLDINELNVNLSGKTEIDQSKKTIVNFQLQLKNLKNFLQDLQENKIISTGQNTVIENFFHEITGKDIIDSQLNIPIYSTKEDSIRLGNADISIFTSYAQLFLFGR